MNRPATYSLLLQSAIRASLIVLATKLLSVVVIANMEGAVVELRTFGAVIPYLSVSSSPQSFLDISTYSTLAMALAATLLLVPTVVVAAAPSQVVWGHLLGLIITAETAVLQVAVHYLGMPNIRVERVWWIVTVLLAGLLLGMAGLGFTVRAPRSDPAPHPSA